MTSTNRTLRNADTNDRLAGIIHDDLIDASDAETERTQTGIVLAYRDDAGVWQHVPDHQEDFYRRVRGETVVRVYVEAE